MKFADNGVIKNSRIFFSSPSQNARQMLYYPLAAGHFYCNGKYAVRRETYESILVLYVIEGALTLVQGGERTTALKDEALFVNCYERHEYFCTDTAQTVWLHFDGADSLKWFAKIAETKGIKPKRSDGIKEALFELLCGMETGRGEYWLSERIYGLLCGLMEQKGNGVFLEKRAEQINRAKAYMEENLAEEVTVEKAARQANISPSHFSKLFKEETGFSPYDYLLSLRLARAKELLWQSDCPVGEVALRSGFHSTANFICFFKKETGVSPLKFRNMKF